MDKINTQRGFTLVELLLYVGISAFILLVVSVFLSFLLQSRIKNQTIAEVEQQGFQAMQIMTQTIRNAGTINFPSRGASSTSLSVNTYVASNNPTVFDLSTGAIRVTEGTGSPIALINSRVTASAPTFQNLTRTSTPGVVRIQFTLTYWNPAGRNEYQYQKIFIGTAALRQP